MPARSSAPITLSSSPRMTRFRPAPTCAARFSRPAASGGGASSGHASRNRWSSSSRVDKDTCAAVFRARLCAAQGQLDEIAPGLRSQLDDGGWDVGDEHQTRQLETLAYLALGALARASRCGLLVNDAHPGTWGAKLLAAWRDLAAESQTGTPAVEPEPDADRLCNPERTP